MLCVVTLLSLCIAACGNQPAKDAAAPDAAPASTASAGAADRCPLSAAQVSAAVGGEVTGPVSGVCIFHAGEDTTVRPNVTFVRQVTFACSGTMPAEGGYQEQLQGLGVTAYIMDDAEGVHVLVCQGQTPFEMIVDADSPQVRRDAAISLARDVLAR